MYVGECGTMALILRDIRTIFLQPPHSAWGVKIPESMSVTHYDVTHCTQVRIVLFPQMLGFPASSLIRND
jgi:hypothetical protein